MNWETYNIRGNQRVEKISVKQIYDECTLEARTIRVPVYPLVKNEKSQNLIKWQQHKLKKEGRREARRLNAASMSVYARSLMAREWARAIGKR